MTPISFTEVRLKKVGLLVSNLPATGSISQEYEVLNNLYKTSTSGAITCFHRKARHISNSDIARRIPRKNLRELVGTVIFGDIFKLLIEAISLEIPWAFGKSIDSRDFTDPEYLKQKGLFFENKRPPGVPGMPESFKNNLVFSPINCALAYGDISNIDCAVRSFEVFGIKISEEYLEKWKCTRLLDKIFKKINLDFAYDKIPIFFQYEWVENILYISPHFVILRVIDEKSPFGYRPVYRYPRKEIEQKWSNTLLYSKTPVFNLFSKNLLEKFKAPKVTTPGAECAFVFDALVLPSNYFEGKSPVDLMKFIQYGLYSRPVSVERDYSQGITDFAQKWAELKTQNPDISKDEMLEYLRDNEISFEYILDLYLYLDRFSKLFSNLMKRRAPYDVFSVVPESP